MAVSAFEHPFLSGLLGDDEVAAHLSAEADIAAMLAFEAALARAEASVGVVPASAAIRITRICETFSADVSRLRAVVATDSVVVPELVAQLRQAVGGDDAQHVHFGSTSQDAIDTSLMLRLRTIYAIFIARIEAILSRLDDLQERFGPCIMMGHTRMQAAIPIAVADRLRSWRDPLERQGLRLKDQKFPVQFGGAAGSLDKFGDDGDAVRAALARELSLVDLRQWQSQRDVVAGIGHNLSLVTGLLGKIGQDVVLMAQMGKQIALSGGGGSSAMAHKQNPVVAETLVALARFNAVQVSGMQQAVVHEQERSGTAWTLEWLILPQIVMAAGAGLGLAKNLLDNIVRLGPSD